MLVERQTQIAVLTGITLSVLVLIFAAWLALCAGELHDFNRSGSLLVIISLALVGYQFVYETSAEHRRERLSEWLKTHEKSASIGIAAGLHKGDALIRALIWRSRFVVLLSSVGVGIAGELVHGFGDLALAALIGHQG
jgi:hypothetical protein